MRSFVVLGILAMALGSSFAFANDGGQQGGGQQDGGQQGGPGCPDCAPETEEACFNLVCNYEFEPSSGVRKCSVASTFVKDVTKDGGEVVDNSDWKNNPIFEVSCDGEKIFNNRARRFTDLLGTRIQGESGPTPAILLPRGQLHTSADGQGGGHYSRSVLELDNGHGFIRGKGSCFIWTGYP